MDDKDKQTLDRKNPLSDKTDGVAVTVSLRDQIPALLMKKLKEQNYAEKVAESWESSQSHRAEWLKRQEIYLKDWDEFLESTTEGPFEGSSTLHLPMPFIVVKTMHARFLQAVLEGDPVVKPRNEAAVDGAPCVQDLLSYTLQEWCNNRRGHADALDTWLWDWLTAGSAVLKLRWDRRFERYMDVVQVQEEGEPRIIRDALGVQRAMRTTKMVEKEQAVTKLVYEGPVFEDRRPEDVLIVGGNGDPQLADSVTDGVWMTASELWSLADQKVFDADSVKEMIEGGPDNPGSNSHDGMKEERAAAAGKAGSKNPSEHDRYLILEDYRGWNVDGSGIHSEVVGWVAKKSKKLLRATYLRRISKAGERPFFKIDFHKRPGQEYGIGLPELLHPLSVEMDAMHNLRIDFGMISTMPFGFYRASSSMDPKTFRMRPGDLIPMDDPNDVVFPQIGNRSVFGMQEEQALQTIVERLTGVNDMSTGTLSGAQGATRTATGARALIGEQSANLDVHLRRLNRGWKQALEALLHLLQQRIPAGLEFRVSGETGDYFRKVRTPEEIAGDYDFELSPNSSNTNRSIQQQDAQELLTLLLNPLLIQLGVVGAPQIYEGLRNFARSKSIRDFNRYFQKPAGYSYVPSPGEELFRLLLGYDVPISPQMDHAGFLTLFEELKGNDEMLGQYSKEAIIKVAQQAQGHEAMMQALQAQQAQTANAAQQQNNAAMSQQQAPVGLNPMAGGNAAQAQQ